MLRSVNATKNVWEKGYLQEKFVLQENLSIGNGDDICWNVGGDVTSLGFNDGQGGERTGAPVVGGFGCAFKQTGVEIENITGVGLQGYFRMILYA